MISVHRQAVRVVVVKNKIRFYRNVGLTFCRYTVIV